MTPQTGGVSVRHPAPGPAPVPYSCQMRDPRAEDPADLVIAWEAVEELLAVIPDDSCTKDVLRMVAAGLSAEVIAERLDLTIADVEALAARGRIRVLTAAVEEARRRADPEDVPDHADTPPDAAGDQVS
jgi:DNA-directed RNA polymerase specialized sigma24 family protein